MQSPHLPDHLAPLTRGPVRVNEYIARLLRERDEARDEGDALARAVADHLAGRPGDLTAALRRYGERGGPAFALAPR